MMQCRLKARQANWTWQEIDQKSFKQTDPDMTFTLDCQLLMIWSEVPKEHFLFYIETPFLVILDGCVL